MLIIPLKLVWTGKSGFAGLLQYCSRHMIPSHVVFQTTPVRTEKWENPGQKNENGLEKLNYKVEDSWVLKELFLTELTTKLFTSIT